MTGHRSALPPHAFSNRPSPTTRACKTLCYNITLAGRGGQCGLCPQHARVNLWAMWATKNKLPTLPTACGRRRGGGQSVGHVGSVGIPTKVAGAR